MMAKEHSKKVTAVSAMATFSWHETHETSTTLFKWLDMRILMHCFSLDMSNIGNPKLTHLLHMTHDTHDTHDTVDTSYQVSQLVQLLEAQ